MTILRVIGIYLAIFGLMFLLAGLIGFQGEPINKSYLIDFPEKVYRVEIRYISISSGYVEIKILSEGISHVEIYRDLRGYNLEKVYSNLVKGFVKLEYDVDLPASYYIYIGLGGVEKGASGNRSSPRLLLDITIYPNLNYTIVIGTPTLVVGLSTILLDIYRERNLILRRYLKGNR